MTLNFPTSIYTNDDAETALGPNTVLTPTDGDTITIGSYGYTFDDDRVDSNGRWVLNSGSTYSLTGGATYTWDLYKWKASNIPDSSTVVQTTSTPNSGDVLTYNNGVVWAAPAGGISLTDLSVGAEGTASGDGEVAYNDTTGVFTYTPPEIASKTVPTGDLVGTSDAQTLSSKTLSKPIDSRTQYAVSGSTTANKAWNNIEEYDCSSMTQLTLNFTNTNWVSGRNVLFVLTNLTSSFTLVVQNASWFGGSAPTLPTSGTVAFEVFKVGSTTYAAYIGSV
jgi:hypothetical protein